MSYQPTGGGGPAEFMCRYGTSKLRFRGPERALNRPYIACLGGQETFGRFVDRPYPAVLQQHLGRRCINFGSLFCGAEALLQDEGLLDLANGAQLCLLQLPDLAGHSNRFYRVHPRRNDRFVAPTRDLLRLYPDEDFTDIHFVGHLLTRLQAHDDARFDAVLQELQRSWLHHLQDILNRIIPPVVALALAVQEGETGQTGPGRLLAQAGMLEALGPLCTQIVQLPAQVASVSDDLEDVLFGTLQQPMAEHMIGPAAHRRIAEALSPVIQDIGI